MEIFRGNNPVIPACLSSSRRLPVIMTVFLPGLLVLFLSYSGWAQGGGVPVVVSTVVQREVTAVETFIGSVMPARRTVVGSGADGRVRQLLVNDGEEVHKGDPLARLRSKTLEIELAAAQAQLDVREQGLVELEHGSLPQEIAQAKARVLDAQALMEYSLSQYKRMKSLFESGTVSRDELDEATSSWLAAEQSQLGAKAAYDLAVQGPRPERIARAKAQVRSQQEEIRLLKDRLGKHTIRAPFDGYVVKKHTEIGAWIRRGDPVVDVIELDPVEIEISIPETYIPYVELGTIQPVQLEALNGKILEGLEGPLQGTVVRIVPQADLRSRTFPVKLRVNNPRQGSSHLLKAGMLARVLLAVAKPHSALLVPKNALVLGGPKPRVFVLKNNAETSVTTAHPVEVEIGRAEGALIQVSGKLQQGDQVVVEGNERLRPGAVVRVMRVEPEEG